MHTAVAFAEFVLEFVPFLIIVAIALFVFWIATKLIPSLNEWMTSTEGMVETEYNPDSYVPASSTFDKYV
jgi:hypothetical protein